MIFAAALGLYISGALFGFAIGMIVAHKILGDIARAISSAKRGE